MTLFTAATQYMSGIETIRIGGEVYREFHRMPTGEVHCIARDGERGQGRIAEDVIIDEATYMQIRDAAVKFNEAQRALAGLTYPILKAAANARDAGKVVTS
jgi:hypothetical protein